MITIKQKNGDVLNWAQVSYSRERPARYKIKIFSGKITCFNDIKPLKVFKTQVAASCYIFEDCKCDAYLLASRFCKHGTKTPKGDFLYLPKQNMTVLRIPVGIFNI
jgi:hypothetical protein